MFGNRYLCVCDRQKQNGWGRQIITPAIDKWGWMRALINRIHPERHVSMTMSNLLPISATYRAEALLGGKLTPVEALTMATSASDCPFNGMPHFEAGHLISERDIGLGGGVFQGVFVP